MIIKHVKLRQMRNYTELSLPVYDGVNILYGANAQGKTNFLESIYFCATGRSPRTHSDKELIQFGSNETHMQILIENNSRIDKIDSHIKKGSGKGIAVNGVPVKKLSELFGILFTVIFSPEDLSLVKSGPAERRKFIDMELCQTSPVYYYDLQQYYKALKHRNALLKNIQKNKSLKHTIPIWDEQLFEHGKRIISQRQCFIDKLKHASNKIYSEISGNNENLEILYKPSVTIQDFMDKLIKNTDKDILLGSTQSGIHKDEILFSINGYDARAYASQGQQRTISLSAKLAEISLIKSEKCQNPVLLLDDVFSELDKKRQSQLIERITGIQTILTCTGVESILSHFKQKNTQNIYCFNVTEGQIAKN